MTVRAIGEPAMLRITVQDGRNQIGLKLEGNLAGPWVAELEETWRAVRGELAGRLVCRIENDWPVSRE